MKTPHVIYAAIAAFLGFILEASGQGNVTFTPIDGTTFSNYLGSALWVGEVVPNNPGFVGFPAQGFLYGYGSSAQTQTSVLLTNGNGVVSLSTLIQASPVSIDIGTGNSRSTSSDSPIIGLAIGIVSSYETQPLYGGDLTTASATDLYINGNIYQPTVADTYGTTFSGMLCSFENPSSTFDAAFTVNSTGYTISSIYIIGIQAVPEPGSVTLLLVSGLILVAARKRIPKIGI